MHRARGSVEVQHIIVVSADVCILDVWPTSLIGWDKKSS